MSNVVEILIRARDQATQVFENLANSGTASVDNIQQSMDNANKSIEAVSATTENVEQSLKTAGETAEKTGDDIKVSLDKAEESGQKANSTIKDMFNNWESHAKKAGLAISDAGVAVDALAQKQAKLTEDTHRLAMVTGMSSKEMRELAIETANVTLPLEDVTAMMETASQQGIRSGEAMQEYTWFWDTLGDAVRGSGPELAKAGVALQQIGIEAGNEKEAIGALGFIFQETTTSVEDFLSFVDKTGPELKSMGADINDSAAILGVLEKN
ncbi:TP901 family phage tail tape measure protein [Bacillus coahuilensis]|uniref:TP901 family phage tail tape measure protein n=1 Tax=Bacillus coahuilensis TaxID=408580 RepID=UPI000185091E|nr:TP901 family phage tail tape measure protein [Bacillus coahuilensis]